MRRFRFYPHVLTKLGFDGGKGARKKKSSGLKPTFYLVRGVWRSGAGDVSSGPGEGARGSWRRCKRSDRDWSGELQVNRWGRLKFSQTERAPLGQ